MISLSVNAGDGETLYYDKTADELQSGVRIEGDKIYGTLNKVTGYKLFPGDDEFTQGHYLVLTMEASGGATIETKMTNSKHNMNQYVTVDDGFCSYEVTDKDQQKIYIKASKGGKSVEKVYDLSNLVLSED